MEEIVMDVELEVAHLVVDLNSVLAGENLLSVECVEAVDRPVDQRLQKNEEQKSHVSERERRETGSSIQASLNASSSFDEGRVLNPLPSSDKNRWSLLEKEAMACIRCPELAQERTNVVFGVGDSTRGGCMVIGEAPGKDEDLKGEPFVGRAGKLLNQMLAVAGLERSDVYIANILKCRPPENRNPHEDEITNCSGFLERQIEQIQPIVILALGKFAASFLLEKKGTMGSFRGTLHRSQKANCPILATYHPAALLRNPHWKYNALQDLHLLARVLGTEPE